MAAWVVLGRKLVIGRQCAGASISCASLGVAGLNPHALSTKTTDPVHGRCLVPSLRRRLSTPSRARRPRFFGHLCKRAKRESPAAATRTTRCRPFGSAAPCARIVLRSRAMGRSIPRCPRNWRDRLSAPACSDARAHQGRLRLATRPSTRLLSIPPCQAASTGRLSPGAGAGSLAKAWARCSGRGTRWRSGGAERRASQAARQGA